MTTTVESEEDLLRERIGELAYQRAEMVSTLPRSLQPRLPSLSDYQSLADLLERAPTVDERDLFLTVFKGWLTPYQASP